MLISLAAEEKNGKRGEKKIFWKNGSHLSGLFVIRHLLLSTQRPNLEDLKELYLWPTL